MYTWKYYVYIFPDNKSLFLYISLNFILRANHIYFVSSTQVSDSPPTSTLRSMSLNSHTIHGNQSLNKKPYTIIDTQYQTLQKYQSCNRDIVS